MTQLTTAPTLYVFNCLQGNCQCFARNSVPPFSTIAPHLTCIYEVIIENGKRNMIFIAEKFILYYFSSFLRGVAQSSLFIVTSLFIIQNKSFLYCAFSFCWQKKNVRNETETWKNRTHWQCFFASFLLPFVDSFLPSPLGCFFFSLGLSCNDVRCVARRCGLSALIYIKWILGSFAFRIGMLIGHHW